MSAVARHFAGQGRGARLRGHACVPLAVDGADARGVRAGSAVLGCRLATADTVVSNVTGELAGADGDFGSAQYWVDHVRRPVRFADSVRRLQPLGRPISSRPVPVVD